MFQQELSHVLLIDVDSPKEVNILKGKLMNEANKVAQESVPADETTGVAVERPEVKQEADQARTEAQDPANYLK